MYLRRNLLYTKMKSHIIISSKETKMQHKKSDLLCDIIFNSAEAHKVIRHHDETGVNNWGN